MTSKNISLVQLETFLWVASLRNFRKTAEKLHTTQPAISSRVAKLEKTLGVRLFERDTSFIRLTPKGLELIPYAEKLLRSSTLLVDRIGRNEELSGLLRLGVTEAIVHTWLPEFISGVHGKFPEIDISIVVDTSLNLQERLTDRSLDFAFLMGPLSDMQIENYDLIEFELIWVASPVIGIPPKHKITLNELSVYPLLTYAENTRPYVSLRRELRKSAEFPPRLFPCSSLAAILRMTLDGIGVAALPRKMIAGELARGELLEIQCEWTPPSLKFTASFLSEPYNPVTEKVIKHALKITADYQSRKTA
ncbi:LysR family transcriptional regulator [Sneathiella sp.]|uniref:LysR family transcriptional regulator n=1 Tax=Sneathiella sp. TaxID=1964365 RepID=UPI00356196F5